MSQHVAVIGCGHWGKNLVRNFNELGALALICEQSEEGRRRASEIAPDCKQTDSTDDVLASKQVEAVVIASPAETHHKLAKAALLAGKDVFVEKPLALTMGEGRELLELAHSNNRILMVGHVLEYHPGILKLQSLIREGELGKVNYIYSNRLSLGKIRREENILWSFAPHDVAIILRIVGELPFQVAAAGGNYVQPNIADVTVTNLLFNNGVRAHIFVSWLHPFKEQRLVVVGSKKMASFDDVGKRLVLYDQRVDVSPDGPVPVKGEGVEVEFESAEPLKEECKAFLEAVKTREQPLTDGKSALEVLAVLEAAQRSLMTNGEVISLSALRS